MNLLRDDWIPVTTASCFRHITLQEVLCTDADWALALPRDDMELAALQLLASLTQVLSPTPDQVALRGRLNTPLSEAEYLSATERFRNWFDLDHARTPFMQTRGVSAKEVTPIQKLFIGLPEGNNHAFFNAEGEIKAVCGGCAAIALFNQASNCPSFGGGFKGSLRGAAPITTLIDAPDLRRRIWENVLPLTEVERLLPGYDSQADDQPVWVDPIPAGKTISSSSIGLLRGLFWQPARVELMPSDEGECDHCGGHADRLYEGFKKEKFSYQLEGVWPHPHGPRQWEEKNGQRHVRFASFTTLAPAWTQLSQFLFEREEEKQGHVPAPVISSRRQRRSAGRLQVLVGGYRNNQASVIERRHELFSFAPGWEDAEDQLADIVDLGLEVKDLLYGSLSLAAKGKKGAFKGIGVDLHKDAERAYYRRSEGLMHDVLQEMDYDGFQSFRVRIAEKLAELARAIYVKAVEPYAHDPQFVSAIAAGQLKLHTGLRKLRE
jgi:CRISPR system Cascade subunit CasA